MNSQRNHQEDETVESFQFELTFHRLEMTHAPKNALFSILLKRGMSMQTESKRRFSFDEQNKQSIFNEVFSFKSQLNIDNSSRRYKEKYVEASLFHWKSEKSILVGTIRINLSINPGNSGSGAANIRFEPLENCSDSTARISYSIKSTKGPTINTSDELNPKMEQSTTPKKVLIQNQRASVSPTPNPANLQVQIPFTSFAYKRTTDVSPNIQKPRSHNDEQLHKLLPAQQDEGQSLNQYQVANTSMSNVTTTTTTTKKTPSIITINKDKKGSNTSTILDSRKQGPIIYGKPKLTNNTVSQSNISDTSEILNTTSGDNRTNSNKSRVLGNNSTTPTGSKLHSHFVSTRKGVDTSSQVTKGQLTQLSSSAIGMAQNASNQATSTILTPRTKTPVPTPRPQNHSSVINSTTTPKSLANSQIGYREKSQELAQSKQLFQVSQERREIQQKQQVPNKNKFIIEGKRRQEAKKDIKDIQNIDLANKLSNLIPNNSITKGLDPQNEVSVEINDKKRNLQDLIDVKKEKLREISHIDDLISEIEHQQQSSSQDFSEEGYIETFQKALNNVKQGYATSSEAGGSSTKKHHGNHFDIDDEQKKINIRDQKPGRTFTFSENQDSTLRKQLAEGISKGFSEKSLGEGNGSIRDYLDEIASLKLTIEGLEKQNQSLSAKNRVLSDSKQAVSDRVLEVEKIMTQQNELIDQLQSELVETKQNLDLVSIQYSQLQSQNQHNTSSYQQQALNDSSVSVTSVENLKANKNNTSITQDENNKYLTQQIKIIQNQNIELSKTIKDQQNTIFEYQAHLSSQEQHIQSLIQNVQQKEAAVEEIAGKKQQEIEYIQQLVSESTLHQQQSMQLQKQINDLQEELQRIYEEKQVINHQKDQIEQQLSGQIHQIQEELTYVQSEFQKQEQYCAQLMEQNENQEKEEVNILRSEIQSMREAHAANEIQVQEAKKEIVLIQEQEKQYISQIENLKYELGRIQQENNSLQTKVSQSDISSQEQLILSDDNTKLKDRNRVLERNAELFENERRMLEDDIASLRDQLSKATSKQQQASQRKIEILEQEKQNLQEELHLISEKLNQYIQKGQSPQESIYDHNPLELEEARIRQQQELEYANNLCSQLQIEALQQKQKFDDQLIQFKHLFSKNQLLEGMILGLEFELIQTKQDFCEALNAAFEKGGNELIDSIEECVSFKEHKKK